MSVETSNLEAQRIVVTATVTIIDMISNIGGILGLFSGISVISVVEAIYWFGKYMASSFTKEDKETPTKKKMKANVVCP